MSTSKIQELYDKRSSAWEQAKAVLDAAEGRGDDLTADEVTTYERATGEVDKITKQIEVAEDAVKRAQQMQRVETDPIVNPGGERHDGDEEKTAYRDAFIAYVTRGMSEMEPEQRKILRTGLVEGEKRAQAVGTNSAGGYLVPEGFRAQIVETMKDFGAVERVAQVLNTATGNNLPWPTNDDTSNVGALLAENTQATEQDLTLGTNDLGAYKYTSKIVRVSLEFLQDVDWIDAEGFLRRKFAERLGRIHNQHFTTGTGTAQPQGIVTGATSGKTAASATAITVDELIDLQHSVDPAYRNERSQFMLSDAALAATRKLKDGNGNYLWQPSVQAGVPSLFLGSRYVVNQDMAVPAASVKSVLYGDFFAGYVIRLVKAFELIRMNERYADYGQVGFVAFDRADGIVQDASAFKALTQAAV